jgi:hypothetical protein
MQIQVRDNFGGVNLLVMSSRLPVPVAEDIAARRLARWPSTARRRFPSADVRPRWPPRGRDAKSAVVAADHPRRTAVRFDLDSLQVRQRAREELLLHLMRDGQLVLSFCRLRCSSISVETDCIIELNDSAERRELIPVQVRTR